MKYLSTFQLSDARSVNPHIYPHNVFCHKEDRVILFDTITIFFGENGSGKSTLLNLIANKLNLSGRESVSHGGFRDFWAEFLAGCSFSLGDTEDGAPLKRLPQNSRYIKSEDILYEVKKIQQESVLQESYKYYLTDEKKMSKKERDDFLSSSKGWEQLQILKFNQDKYSNGETAVQIMLDRLRGTGLYLLDEPEVSLSPQNQLRLAEEINKQARFLDSQFIIVTHSPFFLGTLHGIIYDMDSRWLEKTNWKNLPAMKIYQEFFHQYW